MMSDRRTAAPVVAPALPSDDEMNASVRAAELAARRRRSIQRLADRVLVVAGLLGLWELVVALGWIHQFFISRPSLVVIDLYQLFVGGTVWRHLFVTFYEAVAGLVLGTLLGMLTGIASALWRRFAEAVEPVIIAFSSMPRVAIAPLFVIWFGFGTESKIALATLVVYFIVFFSTFAGLRSIDPVLLSNVRTMGGSELHVLRFVSLPYALAWVFTATKTSISMALIAAVVGEFVGSMEGLGWMMVQASGTLNTTRLFACMVILSIFGSVLFFVIKSVEERVLRWRPE